MVKSQKGLLGCRYERNYPTEPILDIGCCHSFRYFVKESET